MLTAKFKTDLTESIPRLVGVFAWHKCHSVFFFFSAAHLLFRLHLDSFYLVSHEISSVIVDIYIFFVIRIFEYTH